MASVESSNDLIRLYGEFLIEFEFVCSWIRQAILKTLYPDNNEKERNIVEILCEGVTADPLRRKLAGLLCEFHGGDSQIFDKAKNISDKFSKFIELRNSFAHGTAFVDEYDFITETKPDTIALRHPKIRKNGLDLNFKNYSLDDLQRLISSLKALQRALKNLVILITHSDQNKEFLDRHFALLENELKKVSVV